MVSVSRIEGGPQVLSAGVRRTIQSIKEVVGSHSDADIYVALKEANMDPNETAQKLLVQDPFHQVKRKRDRKKENSGNKSFVAADGWKNPDNVHVKNAHSDRNTQRVVSVRNVSSDVGTTQAFRVVRDNRVNQNTTADSKPAQSLGAKSDGVTSNVHIKGNSSHIYGRQKPPVSQRPSSAVNSSDPQPQRTTDLTSGVSERREMPEKKHDAMLNASSRAQSKANGPQRHPAYSSSSSVMGVYSSSSDPIHVPSLNSRPASNVGAIRREVGVVGSRHQLADNSSMHHESNSSHTAGQDGQTRDSARPLNVLSNNEQSSKNMLSASGINSITGNRSFNNQSGSRTYHTGGHQKGNQPTMEWKPKSTLKPSSNAPTVVESFEKASPEKNELKEEVAELQVNTSQLRLSESQNVIIAPHIQVSESDRSRLTFGSLDLGSESSVNSSCAVTEGLDKLSSKSASVSVSESSGSGPAFRTHDTQDEPVQSSESRSSVSADASDIRHMEKKESSVVSENLESYAEVGLVQNSSPPYMPQTLLQEENELPRFSGYDPQMRYDSWLRPVVGDNHRAPGMPLSQEVLNSLAANAIPASSIAMVQQQQQQQLTQMYPQLHVSHFANLMPYRQYLSPVYVPPMPVPGYSNNPAYNHLSSGNSYVLMPGNNTHLTPSGAVKYGVQQFKPVPTANPNGFGNFTNPTGYAINANGVVGSAAGHDDPSQLKYMENLYVPNPQPETSEIWMNTREHPGLQSASYYSMPGQTPHPAYGSHASFNTAAAAAQSSHMQFPAMYHPTPQPAPIPSPHLGGGPALGAQVGEYQQTQLGHLNWSGGNF